MPHVDFQRSGDVQGQYTSPQEAQDELMNLMTIMYIAIQETLNDPEDMASTYGKLRTYTRNRAGSIVNNCNSRVESLPR